MKHTPLKITLLAAALISAACTSTPSTSMLDKARQDYRAVQSNPMSTTYAPLETKQAGEALALANAAAQRYESKENIDQLTYLAQQKISVTREAINQKSAEAQIAQSGTQRDQLLLEQRTAEADRSKLNAKIAQNEASNAKRSTQVALGEAADAKQSSQDAQAQTALAQQEAQAALARNAQLESELKALSAKKTAHGIVITLSDMLFGTNLARLNAEGMRNTQKLAALLNDHPERTVLIEGFTDSVGSAVHNQVLSERRANAVRSALVDLGMKPERIAIRGYGEDLPVAANDTAAHRQLNRRVEIVISDNKGVLIPR